MKTQVILHHTEAFGTLKAVEHDAWPGKVWIHCVITRWGGTQAKRCRIVWKEFQAELAGRGVKIVYSCIPEGEEKLAKWQRLFGMEEFVRVAHTIVFRKELDHGR